MQPNLSQPSTRVRSTAKRATLALLTSTTITAGASAQDATLIDESLLPEVIIEGASIAVSPTNKAKKASTEIGTQTQSPVASPNVGSGTPVDGAPSVEGNAATASSGQGSIESGSGTQLISEQGTAVAVVTGRELRQRQIKTAGDALRSLPGVYVSRTGGVGNETVVRIRGAESNQTLVLIDGVEVNPGISGIFDFANLSAHDIERIELLKGPQSGLYGSNALAGVVNIITTSGKGPLTLRASGETGRFNSQEIVLQASGGNDNAHAAITYQRRETDGFNIAAFGNEDDGNAITNFTAKGGVRVLENLKIDGVFRHAQNTGDRDGFDGIDAAGFNTTSDNLSVFQTKVRIAKLAATLDTLDGAWVHQVHVSRAETDTQDDDQGFFPIFLQSEDRRLTYGYTSTLRIETPGVPGVRHYVTGLVEDQRETFQQISGDNVLHERNRESIAGELRGEYFDTLFLGGTVRRDDSDVFGEFTSWRTQGALKIPGTGLRLHGSAGTGIKYPSFGELFGTFFRFTPNPALQPETSFGWDAGVEASFLGGRAVIDVTYFEANLKDEIVDDFSNFPLITSINLDGESTREGIEVTGRFRLADGLTLGAAYTYLDARQPDGLREVRRPEHTGRIDANYTFDHGRGNLNLAAIYNGETDDNAFNFFDPTITRARLDSFRLVTLAGAYQLTPGVELYGRVENLLDEDYTEVFGYQTAGAAAYAGVRLKLEDSSTAAWAADK